MRLEDVASYMDGAAHEGILGDEGKYIVTKVKFISSDGQFKKYCDTRLSPVEKDDDLSGETTLNLYMSKGCVLDNDLINVSLNLDVESNDRISEITYFVRLNTNDGKVLKSGKFEIENESISKLIPVQFTSKDILKEDYVYLYVEILFTHFEGLPTIASEKVINEFRSKLMILDGVDILKERVERVFRVKVAK